MENRKNYLLKVAVAALCAFNLYTPSLGNKRHALSGLRKLARQTPSLGNKRHALNGLRHRFKLTRHAPSLDNKQDGLSRLRHRFKLTRQKYLPKTINMYRAYAVGTTLLLGYGAAKSWDIISALFRPPF